MRIKTPARGTQCTQILVEPMMMKTLLPVKCAAAAEEVLLW